MKAWILNIGDEILLGNISNTNSQYLAEQLTLLGFDVQKIITIADKAEEIVQTLNSCLGQTQLVVCTGGLGPTTDDLTKTAITEFFEDKLILNKTVLEDVLIFLEKRNRKLNDNNKEQALIPSKARILRNELGTAPGLWLEKQNTVFVFLPGVPHEMKQIFVQKLKPLLTEYFDLPFIYYRFVHTLGLPEAELAEKLQSFEKQLPNNIKIAYLPSPEDIRIRLLAKGKDKRTVKSQTDIFLEKLINYLGDVVWALDNDTLPLVINKIFSRKKLTLSTAESCTGGYIAHLITSVPGSSKYYIGSVISYDNKVKKNLLKVNEQDLIDYGAVSKPVVEQMAIGVRNLLSTDFAVATSGIAGPDGGTEEKPVGTTWIAVATPHGVVSKLYYFGSSRQINIRRASAMALYMLIKQF